MAEYLLLKWGSLKQWELESEASRAAFNKWVAGGVCLSAIAHQDTAQQKAAICELIDVLDGDIQNDWSGEMMSKDEAKRYVLEYGKKA